MRFGVNYTPPNGWFYSWLDFSPSDTARDLDAIAGLGADHIRIFPLWPIVQPNRSLVRQPALDDIVRVVDIAGSFGLDVNVDAVQGHLSSFDFVPAWLDSWHRRNMFTDPAVVESTAEYIRRLSAAVADRPNLLGVTVGNELNQFAHAPHPAPHPVTSAEGHAWAARMIAAARDGLEADQVERPLVTLAQYDAAWYDDGQPFGPEHAADHGDATVAHSWVFNGAASLHGALGPGSVRHGEYLLQLSAAWNRDPLRWNWLQEVGTPTNVIDVGDAADFTERSIRHAADVQRLLGITWWCSHDVSRSLADFPELEYDLGLLTNDGHVKATGRRFAELAAEFGGRASLPPPTAALILDDISAEQGRRRDFRADCAPGGRFAAAWLRIAEHDGRGPQVVLRSRLGDADLVRGRGISLLLEVPDDITSTTMHVAHPATAP